ncbi:TPA: DUF4406 domain-containing protein [Enterobacter hormaechei subsp. hoffmannii]
MAGNDTPAWQRVVRQEETQRCTEPLEKSCEVSLMNLNKHSERKPVVFIAGPMTGYHNFNRDEFNAEARILEERSFTVLNPAILPDGLQHEQYLQITLSMLEQADAVFLLNGWEKSTGATREFDRACELGLLFLYQDWESVSIAIHRKRHPLTEVSYA